MKNGLLVYSEKYHCFNVGDYIQSIAARQFFEKIDCFICRECMHEYSGEEVKVILNGWFTHQPENWPPSNLIHPLFVSFHVNSVAQRVLTSKESVDYLKKFTPIGCRDYNTMDLLKNKGIDAYFTGCLTLTLGVTYKREKNDGRIYFVDPHFKFNKNIYNISFYTLCLIFNYVVVSSIALKMFGSVSFKALLKSAAFYSCYRDVFDDDVLVGAKYIKQEVENCTYCDDDGKFKLAESLLIKYSSANFVVTSRIHCALPCLGIGTPVLYVEDQYQAETSLCRLGGLRNLFHIINCGKNKLSCEITDKKINYDFSFTNKPDYILLAEKLIKTCSSFTGKSINNYSQCCER